MTVRTLLVGVAATRAPFHRALARLPGAEGDVRTARALLGDRGVVVPDASVLLGAAASAHAVKAALHALAAATTDGDLAIFYFSGHGVGLVDAQGDESDGVDEALVCEDDFLLDDWFRDCLWPRARPGSSWVTVVDACCSASATQGIAPTPGRPLPFGTGARQPATTPQHVRPTAVRPPSGVARMVISACSDSESALELNAISGRPARGLFTWSLAEELRSHPDHSYDSLERPVRDRVLAFPVGDGYAAEPSFVFHGPDDRLRYERALAAPTS